ncbi:hypothetical protein [Nostoc sp.]
MDIINVYRNFIPSTLAILAVFGNETALPDKEEGKRLKVKGKREKG